MLVQTTTPRPTIDVHRQPAYILVHTLQKPGISDGSVRFSATSNPELGLRDVKVLEPFNEFPIDGESGFGALEYVVPFWEMFREEDKKRNMYLQPFCTAGFSVVARTAFRSDPRTYSERVVTFVVQMPVTGGGILRMGDMLLDITNPSFDPWAPNPRGIIHRNLETATIYNRMHQIGNRDAIEERRAARIADAEANMMANRGLPRPRGKLLPPGR